MTGRPQGSCKNPDCTFNQGGACVDGFPENEILEKCPNFSEDVLDDVDDEDADSEEIIAKPTDGIILSSGDVFYPQDLYSITRGRDVKIILFAGSTESGKTTLIASIYEKFRHGPFGGHLFAGSETLIGFEKRCHLSRAASERAEAHTDRTPAGSQDILHLRLAESDNISQKSDLLLVDVSGELYDAALNSNDEVDNIPLLRQASFFTYIFDGDKLANKKHRQTIKSKGMGIIRTLYENKALNSDSQVQILFSKKDVLSETGGEEAENFISDIKIALTAEYADKFRSLTFYSVAARPEPGGSLGEAYGVDAILKEWVQKKTPRHFTFNYAEYAKSELSPFDKFCISLGVAGD